MPTPPEKGKRRGGGLKRFMDFVSRKTTTTDWPIPLISCCATQNVNWVRTRFKPIKKLTGECGPVTEDESGGRKSVLSETQGVNVPPPKSGWLNGGGRGVGNLN